jgi:hypothetical protein
MPSRLVIVWAVQVIISLGAPLLVYLISILLMTLDPTTRVLSADEIP